MDGNGQKLKPIDPSKINIRMKSDLLYWTKKLNCSDSELINAVEQVGESAEKVKAFLKKNGKGRN